MTPIQSRSDILHWHLLSKHGNFLCAQRAGFMRPVHRNAGISQIKTTGGSEGEVSKLIYLLVETCWISPMHFSAMPLLWQPVCKYLLILTRTKQCHCTRLWFRLYGSAEYVRVRHWDIHSGVVCIPDKPLHACVSWCVVGEMLLMSWCKQVKHQHNFHFYSNFLKISF